MATLSLNDVTLSYDGAGPVISGLSLKIGSGEFVTVLGPSGSGKTSVLKLAAGFVAPSGGEVLLDGEKVRGPGVERAVVFQDDALFPWLSAIENVEFALKLRGEPRRNRLPEAARVLGRLGLGGFESRKIWELSGGQRQRVGLARALVAEPRFLLMDEPFGALDALTRARMHEVVLGVWARLKPGILFITHDVEEALLLGTRLVVLGAHPGRVIRDIPVSFGRNLAEGETLRSIRTTPRFTELREEILDLVFQPRAAA